MDINLIDEIAKNLTLEPDTYHFICNGGGAVEMVNVRIFTPQYTCRYQGEQNWMTPKCEGCKGLSQPDHNKTIDDAQRNYNEGVLAFTTKLKEELKYSSSIDPLYRRSGDQPRMRGWIEKARENRHWLNSSAAWFTMADVFELMMRGELPHPKDFKSREK